MTFGQAIATCFRKYADFTGRASRPEYWWFALFAGLVSIALNIVGSATSLGRFSLPVMNGYGYNYFNGVGSGNVLTNLWSLAILLPSLAVAVRRLRDSGRSWGNLFWVLLPVVGAIILIVQLCQPSIAQSTTSPLPVPPPPPPGMPAV
jgi:uncharacterized membrane protein YhaH (DUF805 family)